MISLSCDKCGQAMTPKHSEIDVESWRAVHEVITKRLLHSAEAIQIVPDGWDVDFEDGAAICPRCNPYCLVCPHCDSIDISRARLLSEPDTGSGDFKVVADENGGMMICNNCRCIFYGREEL